MYPSPQPDSPGFRIAMADVTRMLIAAFCRTDASDKEEGYEVSSETFETLV